MSSSRLITIVNNLSTTFSVSPECHAHNNGVNVYRVDTLNIAAILRHDLTGNIQTMCLLV